MASSEYSEVIRNQTEGWIRKESFVFICRPERIPNTNDDGFSSSAAGGTQEAGLNTDHQHPYASTSIPDNVPHIAS